MWEQDCDPPPGCDPGELTEDWCTLDPAPFSPIFADGEVIGVTVDQAVVGGMGLPPGTWWTAWSDGISCERVVATFTIDPPVIEGVTP